MLQTTKVSSMNELTFMCRESFTISAERAMS